MRAGTFFVFLLGASVLFRSQAGSIDLFTGWPGSIVDSFGDDAGQNPGGTTFGETFLIRDGNAALNNLTFGVIGYAPNTAPEPCTFEAIIMAWNGSRPTGPILYQSSPQTMPLGSYPRVVFSLNLGGVNVTRGTPYVVFFTSDHFLNGIRSDAAMYSWTGDVYPDGSFVSHYGPDFASLTTSDWGVYPTFADLAIKLDYTVVVPEPAPSMVFTAGIIGWFLLQPRRSRAGI
jgi:hypothetical protein